MLTCEYWKGTLRISQQHGRYTRHTYHYRRAFIESIRIYSVEETERHERIIDATMSGVGEIECPIEEARLRQAECQNLKCYERDLRQTCIMPLMLEFPGTVTSGFQLLMKFPARLAYYTQECQRKTRGYSECKYLRSIIRLS